MIQVDHGDGLAYMAELALMGPYRFRECWLNEIHRIHLLEADPLWPRLILLEPLNISFVYPDEASNNFYALPHLTFTFLSDYTYNRAKPGWMCPSTALRPWSSEIGFSLMPSRLNCLKRRV